MVIVRDIKKKYLYFAKNVILSNIKIKKPSNHEPANNLKEKKEKEPDSVPQGIEDKVKEAYTQNKEINEKISLCTRTVINPVNETLSEKERAKKSK